MEAYSKRVWLNKNDSPSTGSVVAYHGPKRFNGDEEPVLIAFLEVSDCHSKARLHVSPDDTMFEFIEKMELLRATITDFVLYLKDLQTDKICPPKGGGFNLGGD